MNYLQLQRKSESIFTDLTTEFVNTLIPILDKELKIYEYELGESSYFNSDVKKFPNKIEFKGWRDFESEVWLKIKKPLKNGGKSLNRFSFKLSIREGKIIIKTFDDWIDIVDTKILKVSEARNISKILLTKLYKVKDIINKRERVVSDEDIEFAFLNFEKYKKEEQKLNSKVSSYIRPYMNGKYWKDSDIPAMLRELIGADKINGRWMKNNIELGKNARDAFNFILHNKKNHLILPFIAQQFPEIIESRNLLQLENEKLS